ncbi:MAG: hemolysin family protein [Armatimonadota bacterium]|nr:hemolysin family protein [Armatimonadota bacterium]MCX7777752.1 hemolysin family protein [Armatimonadota bacterium]MDW8026194.1 hemolysin family protein [Armatimonadota bacterium]
MDESAPLVAALKLLAGLAALGIGAFFAAAEVGLLGVGRIQIRKLAREGNKHAIIIQRMLSNSSRLVATILIAITTHFYIAEALATHAAIDLLGTEAVRWLRPFIPLAFALLALIFAELAPVTYGISNPLRMALIAAVPIKLISFALFPLIWLTSVVSGALLRLFKAKPDVHYPLITEPELLALIKAAEEQGTITRDERCMLHSAIEFTDITVGEVMVGRRDMVCVPDEMSIEEAVQKMVESGHGRLPVYHGGIDNIVGILYAKDVLAAWHSGMGNVKVREICREPLFVAEAQRAYTVLETMQRMRRAMAIVLDEEGSVAGLVTIEDLVEEIFGEIQDEWETAQNLVQKLSDGVYMVDARLSLRQVERLIDVELPEEEYDTLSELVYESLERLPQVGDRLSVGDVELEVAEMDGRRIKWLKLRIVRRSEE